MQKLKKYFPVLLISLLFLVCSCSEKTEEEPSEEEEEPVMYLNYQANCFYDSRGYKHYDDTSYTSMVGIDVSEFQEKIDWEKVKADGVEFAYMRIARRGATTGGLYDDSQFENNYKGARENGLLVGIYFFSQATTVEEAEEEAQLVLDILNGRSLDLPVVYDLENVYLADEVGRIEDLSKEQKTEDALAFCRYIENNGYEAMIYTGLYWSENSYDMEALSDYPIWFAQYGTDYPKLTYPFLIWQYSQSGEVSGIDEETDLDLMFIYKGNKDE